MPISFMSLLYFFYANRRKCSNAIPIQYNIGNKWKIFSALYMKKRLKFYLSVPEDSTMLAKAV